MTKILKCILVPRTKEFFVAETNKQAAKIGAEKINEIFEAEKKIDIVDLVCKALSETEIFGLK